jgi:hypothetical protein
VLTGIRDIAILEKIWPPTWKQPIGIVSLRIALVGRRSREKRMMGDMKSRQYAATKPNCTNVRVTGYRNWFMMAFPVLDDKAEEAYQRLQRRTKRAVGTEGSVGDEMEARDGRRPLLRCDIDVDAGSISDDRMMLRIAFLREVRILSCCSEPLRSLFSLMLL